jgi:hypothetical protein
MVVAEKKPRERKDVKTKKKGKSEEPPEVVTISEDSIHGRPDKMAGRVKVIKLLKVFFNELIATYLDPKKGSGISSKPEIENVGIRKNV